MTGSIIGFCGTAIGWVVLSLVLVLSPTLGSASSVPALVLGLTMMPLLWRPDAITELRQAPAQLIFGGVVLALTAVYALSARTPADVLFFANFLAMPISALVFLIASARQGRATAVLVARLCLLGAAVGLGFALYDIFVRHLDRAQGMIGNPNLMPRIALSLGFVALSGVFLDLGWRRWLYFFGPLAAIVTTALTGSRGAALAIPALVLVASIFLLRDKQTRAVSMVGGLAAIVAVAIILRTDSGLFTRALGIVGDIGHVLRTGTGGDGAIGERLVMYEAGFAAFRLSPWIGWGWANLGNAAAELRPESFAAEAGTNFMFHNDAVNFAVAGGVVGLACLLALLAAPVAGALTSRRDRLFAVRLYCCLQLSIGYAIFGLTDSTLGYDLPTTLYAFLTAIVLGAFREAQPGPSPADSLPGGR